MTKQTVVFLDEATVALPGKNDPREDIPALDILVRGRKSKLILGMAAQSPSLLHPLALSQPNLVLVGNVGSGQELRTMQTHLGLNQQQLDALRTAPERFLLSTLTGGTPIPMRTLDIQRHPFPDLASWNQEVILHNPALKELIYQPQKMKPSQPYVEKKDPYYRFLEAVNNLPAHPVTFYYTHLVRQKYCGWTKASQIREELEKKGFIKIHKVPNGDTYHYGIQITDKAYDKYQLKKKFFMGKGSDFTHAYIQETLRRQFTEKGKRVQREKQIGESGHFVDLLVYPDALAIEVAIGTAPRYEAKNIVADIAIASHVLVVGNDRAHLEKVAWALPKDAKDQVSFKLFYQLLPKSKKKKA